MDWWQMQDEMEAAGYRIEYQDFNGNAQVHLRHPDGYRTNIPNHMTTEGTVKFAFESYKREAQNVQA